MEDHTDGMFINPFSFEPWTSSEYVLLIKDGDRGRYWYCILGQTLVGATHFHLFSLITKLFANFFLTMLDPVGAIPRSYKACCAKMGKPKLVLSIFLPVIP